MLSVRPSAPSGSRPYSTFDAESRPAATDPMPIPMPIAARGSPVFHSSSPSDLRGVGQDRRGDQAGDRPDEDLPADRQPEDAIGPDRRPADPQRLDEPPLGPGGRNLWHAQGGDQADGREHRQDRPAEPGPAPGQRDDHAPRDRPADDREVRPHLQQAVPRRELLVRQDLGEDAVLGGAEEGGLDPEQAEDRHRRHAAGRLQEQGGGAQEHQHELQGLHPEDHRPLAHPVGEDSPRHIEEHERDQEDHLGQRRPPCAAVALAAVAIASRTTSCFQALSLKAPRAWLTSSPARGCLARAIVPAASICRVIA